MKNLTQEQVGQELVWAGLGDWNKSGDAIMEYEAYGEGRVSMVYVAQDGLVTFKDGYDKTLWSGYIEEDEQDKLNGLLDEFGHYAAC